METQIAQLTSAVQQEEGKSQKEDKEDGASNQTNPALQRPIKK